MPNYGQGFTGYSYGGMPQRPQGYYGYPQPQQFGQVNTYDNVNNIEEAKSYPIAPNTTRLLMDSNNPYIYIKSADAMGRTSLQYFQIVPIQEKDIGSTSSNNYVNREELTDIVKRLEALEKAKEDK